MAAVVVVLGSSNTDLVVRVERIPSEGETVLGSDLFRAAGGKGANQAVAAARLGAEVRFVGAVGGDEFGRQALAGLRAEGIDTDLVRVLGGVPSGVALITVDAAGRNAIAVAPGANSSVSAQDARSAVAALPEGSVLLAQLEVPIEVVREGLHAARAGRHRTVLNPAPVPPGGLPPELLALVDVLTPNEHEAAALVGRDAAPEELARELLERGTGAVVITLGEQGALVATREEQERLPVHRVDAIDTTAAGDAFSGGLVAALAEGRTLPDAARFASAVAALSVTKRGAQPSMPSRAEVERLLSPAQAGI